MLNRVYRVAPDERLLTVLSPHMAMHGYCTDKFYLMVSAKFLLKRSNTILTNSIDGLCKILGEKI